MAKYLFKNAATHLPEYCRPTGEILSMLGDKWSVAILGNLSKGRVRFSQLEGQVEGISQRMLTLTLRTMERDGLVSRTVTPSIPPRVDYELTERGQSALAPLTALHLWADEHSEGILASRQSFDERQD